MPIDLADRRRAKISGSDLSHTTISRANYSASSVDRALVNGCRFVESCFDGASFVDATIHNTQFIACTFIGSSFRQSTLENVTFDGCALKFTSFDSSRCEQVLFQRCTFVGASVAKALFLDCDITGLIDGTVLRSHFAPVIDWRTICRSLRAKDLVGFLRRYGMPEIIATYLVDSAKAIDPKLLFRLMRSTFISYGAPDIAFAGELRDRLHANGVPTFFFATDAVPGERLHRVMRDGVNKYDRIILVCSAASLCRTGVRNEIEETLAREARSGGVAYLIPVTIDNYIFTWDDPLATPVRDRVVADFREYRNPDAFSKGIVRLLAALRT